MSDIAKKAGVSLTTASFVLNGGKHAKQIGASTSARVLETAKEMGYRRNGLARAVAAGKNAVFGYLNIELFEQDSLLLDGILRESASAGYHVKVFGRGENEDDLEVAGRCIEQRVAGLIIRRHGAALAVCQELENYEIPVVFVDDYQAGQGAGCVVSDDREGYRLALEHLIQLGHQRIAYIAGGNVLSQEVLRRESFHEIMTEYGLPVRKEWLLNCTWDYAKLDLLTQELFRQPQDLPTAVLCDGDPLAAVVLRTLSRMNVRVPQDVSIVGYGGFSIAELLNPPLTTVAQPFQSMGQAAVKRLLRVVETKSHEEAAGAKGIELLPTQLVVGESTSVPSRF